MPGAVAPILEGTEGEQSDKGKKIPIRNIWFLLLYASGLLKSRELKKKFQGKEDTPDDILDVLVELLVHFVKERLTRGLTRSFIEKQAVLNRVRGRVDVLQTERAQLLAKGQIACRFFEPSLNTPHNRLIRAALEKGARLKTNSLSKKCRTYATLMYRMGVTGGVPDKQLLSKEVFNHNSRADRQVVAAAKLMLEMAMPNEQTGNELLVSPDQPQQWLRKLFETAIREFYKVTLADKWDVEPGNVEQDWQFQRSQAGEITRYFPKMNLDIVMINKKKTQKIVIDTKFTSLFKKGWYRDQTLASVYIYQMYAYLLSQHGLNDLDSSATGILLHPAVEESVYFYTRIQNHTFVFATVNLNATPSEIRNELMNIIAKLEVDG